MNDTETMQILLVDDEEDIRDVLAISLTDAGYEVFTAENGEEGLEIFREKRPPIILTDIKMPGMDGIELLQRIKLENPESEVIMITGHGDLDLSIKSIKYSAVDFITKPINVDVLEIALKRVCEKITARRKLSEYTQKLETLVREKIELQSRLSSLGLMLGSISHSIKGLLTNMDGGLYLLQSGMGSGKEDIAREGLEQVEQTTVRIKKMVLDILFYAKERNVRKDPVMTDEFAKDLVSLVKRKVKGMAVSVECDLSKAPEKLIVDEEFMRSALINILDNAVDACMEDLRKTEHRIGFSIIKEKTHVIIAISDDGTGMDVETKEKMFNLFFSSKGSHGTGFGLYVTKSIVDQHGGKIEVQSVKGKGSVFKIFLPLT